MWYMVERRFLKNSSHYRQQGGGEDPLWVSAAHGAISNHFERPVPEFCKRLI